MAAGELDTTEKNLAAVLINRCQTITKLQNTQALIIRRRRTVSKAFAYFVVLPSMSRSGELRSLKLKSHLIRTQS